jgi:hypothetical protein
MRHREAVVVSRVGSSRSDTPRAHHTSRGIGERGSLGAQSMFDNPVGSVLVPGVRLRRDPRLFSLTASPWKK